MFANPRFYEIFKYSVDKLSGNADKDEYYCEIDFRECSKVTVEDINFL